MDGKTVPRELSTNNQLSSHISTKLPHDVPAAGSPEVNRYTTNKLVLQ